MRRELILKLGQTAGWLAVLGLGASALTVTLGTSVFADAQASFEPEVIDEEEEDEDAAEVVAAAGPRLKTPITFARNPFCPTCSPEVPNPPEPPVLAGGSGPSFDGARQTQLPITLTATLEASQAEASLAVIHDDERGTRGPYVIGDILRPGVRLASIGPGSILLSNNGVTEYALVGDAPPVPKPKPKSKPKEEPPKTTETSSHPLGADQINCSGGTCTVQRSFVNDLLRNPGVLVGQGNARPITTADGRPGFKISGARRGTLARSLGLRSGDVLVAVGGKDATIEELLNLRARFNRLDQIELTVLRRNKPVDLTLVFEG